MRGKGTKLGEGERKVRLSQDRMPILGEGEREVRFSRDRMPILGEGERD